MKKISVSSQTGRDWIIKSMAWTMKSMLMSVSIINDLVANEQNPTLPVISVKPDATNKRPVFRRKDLHNITSSLPFL